MVWSGIGLSFKLGSVSFQNIGINIGNGVVTARTTDQVLRPHVCHLLYVIGTTFSNMITPVLSLQGPQYVNFPQQNNIEVISWPALSSGLNPIAHL